MKDIAQPVIRQACMDDVPQLAVMIAAFRDEVLPGLPLDPATSAATLGALIRSRLGYVAVLDAGGPAGLLVGAASPSPWAQVLVAEERVWWIARDLRGRHARRMVRDFEAWARGIGARAVGLSSTGKSAGGFYQRLGYRPAESMFLKVFD